MKLSNVLIKPIITEKASGSSEVGKYTFSAVLTSSKEEIAYEVKRLFGTDATAVKTSIVPGKSKRIGRTNRYAKTGKWKKAVVSLKKGQKIDLFEKKV